MAWSTIRQHVGVVLRLPYGRLLGVIIASCILLSAPLTTALSQEQIRVWSLDVNAYDADVGCIRSSAVSVDIAGDPSQRVKETFKFLTSNEILPQLNGFQASVVIGTMQAESGVNLNPEALNASSGAYGIAQWLGSRKASLLAFKKEMAAENAQRGEPAPDNFTVQLLFLKQEWRTTEIKAYNNLKNQTDQTATGIDKAVKDYEADFERSGGAAVTQRQAYAKAIFATLGSQAATTTTTAPTTANTTSDDETSDTIDPDEVETTPVSTLSSTAADECAPTVSTLASGTCAVTSPIYGEGGNRKQYSEATLKQLFGDHGTAASHPEISSKLTTVDFLGKRVQVHSLAASCLTAVANDLKNSTYTIRMMGCYRFDGTGFGQIGTKSYHTYGVACDINWDTNKYYSSASGGPHDIPDEFVTAFHNHGWSWGGGWSSPKDYMHFEFNGIDPEASSVAL